MATEPEAPPPPLSASETEALRQAFALFSSTSTKLAEAYEDLQGQVARLSAELAAANGELARRERLSALGEMAAKLAHQLRTPLAAALLYVGHLQRPQLQDADRRRFADKAMARLQYLERLISDMLAFVKGAQGVKRRFPAHDLLAEVQQLLEGQAALLGVGFVMDDQTHGQSLEADRQALCAALISLLENALQVSRSGQSIKLSAQAGAGPFLVFRVEDHGPGLAAAQRERLFAPFYTTRPEGSGLGLAIVKQTADAHGGWVEVESAPGMGCVFTLFIPVTAEDQA